VTTPYYDIITTTSTQTSLVATVTSANFKLQGHAPGTLFDGNYGRVVGYGRDEGYIRLSETRSVDTADLFTLAIDCAIEIVSSIDYPQGVDNIGYENNYDFPRYVEFHPRGSRDARVFGTLICSIDRTTMELNCVVSDGHELDYMFSNGVWQIYTDTQGSPPWTLEVISA
jgi:hypothetical protein